MFRNKFNLRKVVVIAICLAGVTMFSGCDKENNPIETEKKDVRIGWSVQSKGVGNQCDGKLTNYSDVLTENVVDSLKKLPETKDIVAYVCCDKATGVPQVGIQRMIEVLTALKGKGVKYESGLLYINDNAFTKADSIKAQQELNLTLKASQYQ